MDEEKGPEALVLSSAKTIFQTLRLPKALMLSFGRLAVRQ